MVVAVICPHSDEAFEACRWLIDTLKEVVPIWKKEVWADGTESGSTCVSKKPRLMMDSVVVVRRKLRVVTIGSIRRARHRLGLLL